jgi:ABC-type sugar transport system permease subunit
MRAPRGSAAKQAGGKSVAEAQPWLLQSHRFHIVCVVFVFVFFVFFVFVCVVFSFPNYENVPENVLQFTKLPTIIGYHIQKP